MIFKDNINSRNNKAMQHAPLKTLSLLSLLSLIFVFSCRQVPVVEIDEHPTDPLKENRINANRIIAQSEETQIDAYVTRRNWEMQRIPGGSRLMCNNAQLSSFSSRLNYGDTVQLLYSVETIGGETIYMGLCDTVVVGRAQPNRGVDEALLYLAPGNTATVIVPSEQAFGVIGDGDRITSRMILVYKITINNITQQ